MDPFELLVRDFADGLEIENPKSVVQRLGFDQDDPRTQFKGSEKNKRFQTKAKFLGLNGTLYFYTSLQNPESFELMFSIESDSSIFISNILLNKHFSNVKMANSKKRGSSISCNYKDINIVFFSDQKLSDTFNLKDILFKRNDKI